MKSNQTKLLTLIVVVIMVAVVLYSIVGGDQGPDTPNTQNTQQTGKKSTAPDATVNSPRKPTFDLVRISQRGTGIIAGNSEPNALVTLFGDGKKMAEVKAENNGDWVVILNEPLTPGSLKFTVQSSVAGKPVIISDDEVLVSVPERDAEKFLKDKKSGVIALLSKKDGSGPSKVLQKPGGAVFSDVGDSLSIDTIEYGEGAGYINGRSLPRVEVRIYLDEKFLGAEKANDNGEWSIRLSQFNLALGQHKLRVDQTLSDGDVKLRIEQPFETGVPLDPSQAENGVIVKPGNTLWHIARRLYGSGVKYTMIFQENSEKITDPNLIYPGQTFKLPSKKK